MAGEFDLIKTYFEPLSQGLANGELGIGDDGAVLNTRATHQLVVVTDTLISGVHFPVDATPYDIAWKSLAVNLSDLAAMGAEPAFFSLALTLPSGDEQWLADFASGLADIATQFHIPLIGGDTTKGPLSITITANGWVKQNRAVLRSGAQEGDLICVTNEIGSGALGLKMALKELPAELEDVFTSTEKQTLLRALHRPTPQNAVASLLTNYAHSAIDISDGLLADLEHVLQKSNQVQTQQTLTAKINLECVPLHSGVSKYIERTGHWALVTSGGDDYQICFTLPQEKRALFESEANKYGINIAVIGEIEATQLNETTSQPIALYLDNQPVTAELVAGYRHF